MNLYASLRRFRFRRQALARLALALTLPISAAHADWRTGRVTHIYIGYDGSMFTMLLEGVSKTNCTCYPTWPNHLCLDRTRTSFKEEVASILMAKAQDRPIHVNIDETSCKVIAFGLQ
jgi:hypothetical protein